MRFNIGRFFFLICFPQQLYPIRSSLLRDSKVTFLSFQLGVEFFTAAHLLSNERSHNLSNLQPFKERSALLHQIADTDHHLK